jgi:hypothetical protein
MLSQRQAFVQVKRWTSILWVSNEVLHGWLCILQHRGLPHTKLLRDRDGLTAGLTTWLLTGHLKTTTLEIYQEGVNRVLERWEFHFSYQPPGKGIASEEQVGALWRTHPPDLWEYAKGGEPLPPGTDYRLVFRLWEEIESRSAPEISELEGGHMRGDAEDLHVQVIRQGGFDHGRDSV